MLILVLLTSLIIPNLTNIFILLGLIIILIKIILKTTDKNVSKYNIKEPLFIMYLSLSKNEVKY